MRFAVGVRGLKFSAAHYTLWSRSECAKIHGHTFSVEVEVLGNFDERSYMVLDFLAIKEAAEEVVRKYDRKVLVPAGASRELRLPASADVKELPCPNATAECIAAEIAKELWQKLGVPVRVKLFEGPDYYAIVEVP